MATKSKIYLAIIATLIFFNWWAWLAFGGAQSRELKVTFFNVGQGDATLVSAPHNFQILVDGGPNNEVLSKVGSVMPRGDKTIELVVISHPDRDHISGLVEILRRYKVEHVLLTLVSHNLAEYQEVQKLIKDKMIPMVIARAPQRLSWGDGYLDVLYPFKIATSSVAENKTNQTSIVSRLVFGESSVLFSGDLEAPQELELEFKGIALSSDILKVAHHGSKNSSSERFLETVRPQLAIISVASKNLYKHPHQEVLDRLSEKNIKILRTDIEGDITLKSDGLDWQLVEK